MITIQTGELTGIIGDIIRIAPTPREHEDNAVIRLMWDGTQLHAEASHPLGMAARSSWDPGDETSEDIADSAPWGGSDLPWDITITTADAKHIIRAFRLCAKQRGIPAYMERTPQHLRVGRNADPDEDISALTLTMGEAEGYLFNAAEFDALTMQPHEVGTPTLAIGPTHLKTLGFVRPRGPISIHGCYDHHTILSVGPRFRASLAHTRQETRHGR